MDPLASQQALAADHFGVDLRTAAERRQSHLPDTSHLPVDELAARADELPRDRPLLLICQSDARAHKAAKVLREKGFSQLDILDGGLNAWQEEGLPLASSGKKTLPIMRQVQLTVGLLSLIGSLLALSVNVNFALLPAFLGAGLTMAGATGWCGLAKLLGLMPWNR